MVSKLRLKIFSSCIFSLDPFLKSNIALLGYRQTNCLKHPSISNLSPEIPMLCLAVHRINVASQFYDVFFILYLPDLERLDGFHS